MGGGLRESILGAVLACAGGRTRSGADREAEGGKELPQWGPRAWRGNDFLTEAEEVMQTEMVKTLHGRLRTRAVSQGHQEVVQVFWL